MEYLKADKTDIPKIAAMHIVPSVNLFLDNIQKEKDFRFYLEKVNFFMEFEPEGVIVAKEGTSILGFIIVTKDASYLIKNAFFKGYVFRWAINAVLGRFGLNANMMKRFIRFFISFLFIPLTIIKKIPRAKVIAIVVTEEKRNLGIGRSLIDKAIQYLKENNIKSICVTAQINNFLALSFYKSCGFSISGSCLESIGKSFILTKTFN